MLILCTGNSCRSQMAEAVLRSVAGDLFDVASAGSDPTGRVHPMATRVLEEIGLDVADQRSKHVDEFAGRPVDTVITVCANAQRNCPAFPDGTRRFHWEFQDPAEVSGSEERCLGAFRDVRDRIRLVFEAFGEGYRRGLTRGGPLSSVA